MRKSTLVMVSFAVVFGLLAVFIAQAWLNAQAERRLRSLEAQKKQPATNTIVVAAQRLPFGVELAKEHLREIPWASEALPQGEEAPDRAPRHVGSRRKSGRQRRQTA